MGIRLRLAELERLLERLCDSGVTLPEAAEIRTRIFELMGWSETGGESGSEPARGDR
jgi:hypothetical protein